MNPQLRAEIVRHVFANFGVIPSEYVNREKSKSLMMKDYLLPESLSFEDEDGIISEQKIWGCQLSADIQEIKILLSDCTQDDDSPEFCLLIQLKNAPAYGLYLTYKESFDTNVGAACMLAYSMDTKSWLECSTFLQATFLAGMEQIRETGFAWNKATSYQPQYQALLSFVKYHSTIYEAEHEGQEG
jgi:hypothetical protein